MCCSKSCAQTVIAASTYLFLVLAMWLPFTALSGMPAETAFPYMSETSSLWGGFLYRADPLRIHTNTFYHLSYLLGEVAGLGGSFLPYQMVYAALWWARGLLVFVILRRLVPDATPLHYLAGALVIVHASDGALQWVGQMNQFGFIFWTLLAGYLLVRAAQAASWIRCSLWAAAAALCEYMSLWSYESQLFLMLAGPAICLGLVQNRSRRQWAVVVAWYVVPAIYIVRAVERYGQSGGRSYQEGLLRRDWSGLSILSDWLYNAAASLKFWGWAENVPWKLSPSQLAVLAAVTGLVFLLGAAAFVRFGAPRDRFDSASQRKQALVALAVGSILLLLSFPVYLLLEAARNLWRTQFLSGIGAGLVMASGIVFSASFLPRRGQRTAACLTLGTLVSCFGGAAAIKKGAFMRGLWERHRAAIAQVIGAAPGVKTGAVIIAIDVPKSNDPFGDNYWFDMALRLAYPRTPLAGNYFYDDGTPAPGQNLKLASGKWQWNGKFLPPLVRESAVENTIVMQLGKPGAATVLKALPELLGPGEAAQKLYNPVAVKMAQRPAARVLRRYGPIPQ